MPARVTQSFLIVGALQVGSARVTQSYLIVGVGLGVVCNNPPAGALGIAYAHTFLAASGDPPYTFSITSGALPTGLVMSSAGIVSGIPITPGTYLFTVTVTDTFFATASVACSIVIPAATAGSPLTTGGLPIAVQGCRPRNHFDWCMFDEALRLRKITFPPSCTIPREYRCRYPVPWGDDFGANAIPAQAEPLNKTGGIVTPATAAGDTLVIEERVPQGYDGLLQGVYWFYTGSGFDQGSGDIIWRVQLGQRFLEDLGAVPYQMGSPQSPMPMTEGQILLSGQTVRVLVNVPNLSGMIQVGASRIAAGLIGFYWPR